MPINTYKTLIYKLYHNSLTIAIKQTTQTPNVLKLSYNSNTDVNKVQ